MTTAASSQRGWSTGPNRKAPLLTERLWAQICRVAPSEADPDPCWLWTGARSRSGRRKVQYGGMQEGSRWSRQWKAHRLVLLLAVGPIDVPPDDEETFEDWLTRANRHYRGLEAAHLCDTSLCCNPGHLEFQTHEENLSGQRGRETARRLAERIAAGSVGEEPAA